MTTRCGCQWLCVFNAVCVCVSVCMCASALVETIERGVTELCVQKRKCDTAYTPFCRLWKQLLPSVVLMKPMSDVCELFGEIEVGNHHSCSGALGLSAAREIVLQNHM